jgi:hypothetical protein
MLGMPLHPLVVHFPIVLAVLLPVFTAGALWAIRRGTTPRQAWALPLAVAAALALSAYVATETGEDQEDRVEHVVSKRAFHAHEAAAERFLVFSGVLLVVSAAGLARGTVGQAARLVATAGAIGLVAAGIQTGHSGGLLVYREGAASAYAAAPPTGGGAPVRGTAGIVPATAVVADSPRAGRRGRSRARGRP